MMAFLTLIETKSTKAAQVGVNNTPRRRAREVIKKSVFGPKNQPTP